MPQKTTGTNPFITGIQDNTPQIGETLCPYISHLIAEWHKGLIPKDQNKVTLPLAALAETSYKPEVENLRARLSKDWTVYTALPAWLNLLPNMEPFVQAILENDWTKTPFSEPINLANNETAAFKVRHKDTTTKLINTETLKAAQQARKNSGMTAIIHADWSTGWYSHRPEITHAARAIPIVATVSMATGSQADITKLQETAQALQDSLVTLVKDMLDL